MDNSSQIYDYSKFEKIGIETNSPVLVLGHFLLGKFKYWANLNMVKVPQECLVLFMNMSKVLFISLFPPKSSLYLLSFFSFFSLTFLAKLVPPFFTIFGEWSPDSLEFCGNIVYQGGPTPHTHISTPPFTLPQFIGQDITPSFLKAS